MKNISPSRLRTIRQRRGLTITELAKRSGVSAKTISNAEKSTKDTVSANEHTINRLSHELGQRPEVLSGQEELPKENSSNKEIHLKLDTQTRLNYELLERRYGVTKDLIFTVAPFLFALVAEESLDRQLREIEKEEKSGKGIQGTSLEMDVEYTDSGELVNFYNAKHVAVKNNEILAQSMKRFYEYDFLCPCPFAEYLYEKRHENRIVRLDYDEHEEHLWEKYIRIPSFTVCDEELDRICLGSTLARAALTHGYVSIKEISDYLWEPKNSSARIEWLEKEFKDKYEKENGEQSMQTFLRAVEKYE